MIWGAPPKVKVKIEVTAEKPLCGPIASVRRFNLDKTKIGVPSASDPSVKSLVNLTLRTCSCGKSFKCVAVHDRRQHTSH